MSNDRFLGLISTILIERIGEMNWTNDRSIDSLGIKAMEVIVYTRPDCESSRRIKEILENRGVAFQEHVCADGKLDGKDLRNLDIEVRQVPLTVIDGVPIAGLQQAKIEQAIGWIGF